MKILIITIMLLSFLFSPLSNRVYPLEMSAGASTWYVWWDYSGPGDIKTDPALMFGPLLSARFSDQWSLSAVFLYGRFNNTATGDHGFDTCNRYDSDISLNYNLNRYFKIFGGGKFIGFSWKDNHNSGFHWSAGPGLGIGATFPLTNNLFLLANFSGVYTRGQDTADDRDNVNIEEKGVNSNISIAYYISSASTSINLGFRHQYIRCDYDTDDSDYETEKHHFYGITLTAVYSFGD